MQNHSMMDRCAEWARECAVHWQLPICAQHVPCRTIFPLSFCNEIQFFFLPLYHSIYTYLYTYINIFMGMYAGLSPGWRPGRTPAQTPSHRILFWMVYMCAYVDVAIEVCAIESTCLWSVHSDRTIKINHLIYVQ